MSIVPLFLVGLCIAQRLFELRRSARNRRLLKERGYTRRESLGAYGSMVFIHAAWLIGCIIEPVILPSPVPTGIRAAATAVYLIAQALRIWVLRSLGESWNTTVFTSDRASPVVTSGPYRFVRHPNYLVIILEFASLPLVGGAIFTAAIGSVLNGIVLARRIRLEERFLNENAEYRALMGMKPRFLPRWRWHEAKTA